MTEEYKKIGKTLIKFYTKDEIKFLITHWEELTIQQLSEVMERNEASLYYLANKVRAMGYPLSKKNVSARVKDLIKEALEDIRLGK